MYSLRSLTSSQQRILLGIVTGGFLLRLCLIFPLGTPPELFEYDKLALNLLSGHGYVYNHFGTPYRSFYSGIFYVGLTALLYAAFPAGHTALLVAQSLFSALLAVAVFSIGRALWGRQVGLLAAILTISHPALVYYDTRKLHPLSFDALVISLAVLALLWVKRNSGTSHWLLAGLLLGVAILQRGSMLLLLPLGQLWLWFFGRRGGYSFVRGAVYILGVALVVSPWVARNYAIHGSPFLETPLGSQFWRGNIHYSYGSSYLPSGRTVFEVAPEAFRVELQSRDERGQAKLFWQSALATVRGHPWTFIGGVGRKFLHLWTFAPQTGILYPSKYFYLYAVYYLMMAALAVLGTIRLLQDSASGRVDISGFFLLCAVFLSVSVVHSVLYVEIRHRWAIEPMLLVLSSVGLLSLSSRRGRFRRAVLEKSR